MMLSECCRDDSDKQTGVKRRGDKQMMAVGLEYTVLFYCYIIQSYTDKNGISCKTWTEIDTKDYPFMVNKIAFAPQH